MINSVFLSEKLIPLEAMHPVVCKCRGRLRGHVCAASLGSWVHPHLHVSPGRLTKPALRSPLATDAVSRRCQPFRLHVVNTGYGQVWLAMP